MSTATRTRPNKTTASALKPSRIPKFKTLEEESEFWDTHSILDYWDETEEVQGPFIDARPPKKLVSIRFDPSLISATKRVARTKGVGYQTLLRMWAYEGLARELRGPKVAKPRPSAKARRKPAKKSA
jgi:predicted DNA binding CopG/RHH family protein